MGAGLGGSGAGIRRKPGSQTTLDRQGSGWCERGFCGWPISRIDLPVLRKRRDGGDGDCHFTHWQEGGYGGCEGTWLCAAGGCHWNDRLPVSNQWYRWWTTTSDRTRAHLQMLLRHGHTAWPPIYPKLTPLRELSLFRFKMRCAPFAVRFTEGCGLDGFVWCRS
jgi:hypothetical protein